MAAAIPLSIPLTIPHSIPVKGKLKLLQTIAWLESMIAELTPDTRRTNAGYMPD